MFLCYLTGHKYFALRKGWLCWLQLTMLGSKLVPAACGRAGTQHASRRWAWEQGEGWGAAATLSRRAGQPGHRTPSGAGSPFPKASEAPGSNGDAAAGWLLSRLVPEQLRYAEKGSSAGPLLSAACPTHTVRPRGMAACKAGAEWLFPPSPGAFPDSKYLLRLLQLAGTGSACWRQWDSFPVWDGAPGRALPTGSDLLGCWALWGCSAALPLVDTFQTKCISSSLGVLGDR